MMFRLQNKTKATLLIALSIKYWLLENIFLLKKFFKSAWKINLRINSPSNRQENLLEKSLKSTREMLKPIWEIKNLLCKSTREISGGLDKLSSQYQWSWKVNTIV